MPLIVSCAFLLAVLAFVIRWVIDQSRCIINVHPDNLDKHLGDKPSILIVTAHPDDECLFFAPTIRILVKNGCKIHLLCLSNGNHRGNGSTREKELLKSCIKMGIPHERCLFANSKELCDSPAATWSAKVVGEALEACIAQISDVRVILTFDCDGVSGHPNHRDTAKGVRWFVSQQKLRKYTVWEVESVPLGVKYWGPLAVAFEAVQLILERWFGGDEKLEPGSDRLLALVDFKDYWTYGVGAMRQHVSQLVWFRWLYVLFSRYMHMNILAVYKPVGPE